MTMIRQPSKNKYLAPIHCAKRDLCMDDDTYRALLERVAKVRSSRDLSPAAATRVLHEFERLGWVNKAHSSRGRPHNFARLPLRIRKIEAQLASMGLDWAYADGIARQMFRIQRVAWIRRPDQLDAIIAALHAEQSKRLYLARIEARCQELGFSPESIPGVGPVAPGWRRQLSTLRAMLAALEIDDKEAP